MTRPVKLVIAAAAFTTLAAAPAAPRLLRPLSEADMMKFTDSGCDFAFGPADVTFLYARNSTLMLRVGTGSAHLRTCDLDPDAFNAFQEGDRSMKCGDLSLSLRRVGAMTGNEEADSTVWPAELRVSRAGGLQQKIRGDAGVAC